MCVLSLSAHH